LYCHCLDVNKKNSRIFAKAPLSFTEWLSSRLICRPCEAAEKFFFSLMVKFSWNFAEMLLYKNLPPIYALKDVDNAD
jgi:hypothetical protein